MIRLDSTNLSAKSQHAAIRFLITKEKEFWQDKLSELDSDIEVQQMRNAASRIQRTIMRTKVIRAEKAPILIGGELPSGQLAITFDDGPHPVATRQILHTLRSNGISCNFFLVGSQTRKYPIISRWLSRQGHVVGSHSMTHKNLTLISEQDAQKEIIEGHNAVSTVTGQENRFFRFPFGSKTEALQGFVQQNKLATFFYNIDSYDWDFKKQYNSDLRLLLRGIISLIDQTSSGILLFHDTHQTALVLPDVLNYIKIKRHTVVQFVSGN